MRRIIGAFKRFDPLRPTNYRYLTRWKWFHREVSMLGCRLKLWHIGNKHGGCFCDFWDAQ